MRGDWLCAQGGCFTMASLSLFSPLIPAMHTVSHHTLRLLYGLSGQAQVRCGGCEETLLGNRMLLLREDTAYETIAPDGSALLGQLDIAVQRNNQGLSLSYALCCRDPDYADFCSGTQSMMPFQDASGLVRCLTNVLQFRPGRPDGGSGALTELAVAALMMVVSDALYDTENASAIHSEHVQHVLKFIHTHYMEGITVEDVALDVHLHPNYLHRLFAGEMHRSIGEYLTSWRMEKARSLLIGSRTHVSEVARMCGMPNHQHFTKTFRKAYGMSPIDFRRKYDITCNYAEARSQYGVIHYSTPDLSESAAAANLSFFDPIHKQRDFVPVVKAYYSRADMLESTKDTTDHSHSLYEIMYVQEGMITVETEDATLSIGRHQYIWLDASVHHKLTLSPGMPSSVVNIEFAFQPVSSVVPSVRQLYQKDDSYAAMLNQPAPWLMLNDNQDMMGSLLQQVVLLANSTHRKKDLLCSALTQQCLMIMAAQRMASKAGSLQRYPGDPLMERAAQKVEELYAQPLTVDQLAADCGTTVAHLQQIFHRCTGLTVHEYMQRVRIDKSKPLLQNSCTVLEAATRVGFSGQQYYAQLFKRMNGITPASYRLRYQKRKLQND